VGEEPARVKAVQRVFLLSPADSSGLRATRLCAPEPGHDLARRLHDGGAPLGEVFSFVSSLYFRGKLAYARAFARPPQGAAGIHVITPADGLQSPDAPIRVADLQRWAGVPIDLDEERYRAPLVRDLDKHAAAWRETEVVLLGSVASGKYVDLLGPSLGARLVFPPTFVGRGDMSRGGLMLRCVAEGRELDYAPLLGAPRRGARPGKLAPLPRRLAGRS
jgi:hypothetical protein